MGSVSLWAFIGAISLGQTAHGSGANVQTKTAVPRSPEEEVLLQLEVNSGTARLHDPTSTWPVHIVGENQPPQSAAPCTSVWRAAAQYWWGFDVGSDFKGATLLNYLCLIFDPNNCCQLSYGFLFTSHFAAVKPKQVKEETSQRQLINRFRL